MNSPHSTTDLHRQLARHGAPYRDPTRFPQKTVNAMRMLAGVEDQRTRISLSHDLYRVSVDICTSHVVVREKKGEKASFHK